MGTLETLIVTKKSNIILSSIYPVNLSLIATGETPAGVPVKIKSPIFNVKN